VGNALLAAWRQLCYKLTYHRLFSISLKHWIWALVVLPPLIALIGRLSWGWAVVLSALGAAALIGAEGARRKQYILFVGSAPEPTAEGADPAHDVEETDPSVWSARAQAARARAPGGQERLEVDEPLRCWASGRLGVEGKARALACERASISFVRTREHVVMAQVRRTRFLLLAPVPKADVGYWYAFFYPRQVQGIRQGTLYCGFSARPAVELQYADGEGGQSVQLYLAFEDPGTRQRLLDDLRQDVSKESF